MITEGHKQEVVSYITAKTLIAELFSCGVKDFCVSPGYRNSPLISALAQIPGAKIHSHIDERGIAFFALGIAKATSAPVALICTSGTAAANYFPALLEASYGHTPLVFITADRPQELLDVGANQSMDQIKLFGSNIRFFSHIPALESANENLLCHIKLVGAKAVNQSKFPLAGPTHINIAFREPFFLKEDEVQKIEKELLEKSNENNNETLIYEAPPIIHDSHIKDLVIQLTTKEKVLIAVGPGTYSKEEISNLCALSEKLKAPLLAEASSGLGFFTADKKNLCLRVETILSDREFIKSHNPGLILRYGAQLTSKRFIDFHKKSLCPTIIFDENSQTRSEVVGKIIFLNGGPGAALKKLVAALPPQTTESEWLTDFHQAELNANKEIIQYLESETALTEWHIAHAIASSLKNSSCLFLGNSMPIRDFDFLAPSFEKYVRVFSNRALSGIDGLLSTALGIASGSDQLINLLIGDISFLHDINTLTLVKRMESKIRMNFFVINNGGGEIFRQIPTSNSPGLESLFTTPQFFELKSLAKGFGINYCSANSQDELFSLLPSTQEGRGVNIIELIPDAQRNTTFRKEFWNRIKK